MNRKALFTIFMIILTDIIGFGIVIPLMPTISQNLGISGLALGMLTASYAIAQFIASPILGSLSDKYGRKPILIISKLGTVVAYIMLGLSHSYWLIILSRLIDGFTGGNIPAARAYISDVTTKEDRSKGMAIIGVAFGLGFILGPALGGIFFSLFHTVTAPALVGALLSFISLILTQLFLDESHRQNQVIHHRPFSLANFFGILRHPEIEQILLVQFFLMMVVSGYQSTITFFTDSVFKFNASQNSLLLIYLGVIGLFSQGYLVRRSFGDNLKATKIGLVVMAIAISLISLSPNYFFMAIFLALNSMGGAVVGVTLPTLLSTTSSTDPEGEIQGAYEGVGALGRVIGPAILGSFISIFPRQLFLISGLSLLFVPLLFRSVKSPGQSTQQG
jgi:DHA1 family tetracycline resistance protein-like MFS transporter